MRKHTAYFGFLFVALALSISCKKDTKVEKPEVRTLFNFNDVSQVKVENIMDASHELKDGKLVIIQEKMRQNQL